MNSFRAPIRIYHHVGFSVTFQALAYISLPKSTQNKNVPSLHLHLHLLYATDTPFEKEKKQNRIPSNYGIETLTERTRKDILLVKKS